jgi:predicted small metal-binding protein
MYVVDVHGGCVMTRELHCRDVGFDCDAVVTAESDDEILAQVAAHAKAVHGLTDEQLGDPGLQQLVRDQTHELPSTG